MDKNDDFIHARWLQNLDDYLCWILMTFLSKLCNQNILFEGFLFHTLTSIFSSFYLSPLSFFLFLQEKMSEWKGKEVNFGN